MKKKKVMSDTEFWQQANKYIRRSKKYDSKEDKKLDNKEYLLRMLRSSLFSINRSDVVTQKITIPMGKIRIDANKCKDVITCPCGDVQEFDYGTSGFDLEGELLRHHQCPKCKRTVMISPKDVDEADEEYFKVIRRMKKKGSSARKQQTR